MTQVDEADPTRITTRAELARGLSALRVRAGLTVRELARRIDLPPATVGGYLSGRHVPGTAQQGTLRRLLVECGVTAEDELTAWLDAVARARSVSDGRSARAGAPYRGLEPFGVEDSALFFGRSRAVRETITRLAALHGRGLLLVLGPSGSGKSSLLRAGLLPAVAAGGLGGDGPVATAWITPGADPLAALRAALAGRTDGSRLLLVVDQFEEVFTSAPADARVPFVEALTELGRSAAVVIGMRADFYAAATGVPALVAALEKPQVVTSLTTEEVREAIVEPARAVGAVVDDAFVDLVLADLAPSGSRAAHDPGALPLLSHALLATWERARRNHLTIADYRAAGGLDGAVQQTAEQVFAELSPAGRELARRIFLRLVNVDDDQVATRRRVRHEELADLVSVQGGETVAAEDVVDRFVDRRLLTVDAETVEVSHEALLGAWARLRDWLEGDRAGQRLHRRLTQGTLEWLEAGRDDALLPRGTRLESALEWAADHDDELNRSEREYLDAGRAALAREQRAGRLRTRRLQRLLAAVAVLALLASGLAVYSIRAQRTADRQRAAATHARDEALSRQIAIESVRLRSSDPALARQLALAAYRVSPTVDARSVLLDTTAEQQVTRILGASGPTALAGSPDGSVLAVGHNDDGSVHLYATHGDAPPTPLATIPGTGPGSTPFALAFSPDGRVLAVGGMTSSVTLWDLADPRHPQSFGAALRPRFGNAVQALAFTPDGTQLLAAGTQPALAHWDVRDPSRPRALPRPVGLPADSPTDPAKDLTAQSLAVTADGRTVALGGTGGTLLVWPGGLGAAPVRLPAGSGTLASAAFSPDSALLAVGSKDDTVRVYDVRDRRRPHRVPGPTTRFGDWVTALAFTPDGRRLAGGSSDNRVLVWSVDGWTAGPAMPHTGPVTGMRWSPDASELYTTAADGQLRMWHMDLPLLPAPGSVFSLTFDRGGGELAVGSTGPAGTAQLWNVHDPGRPTRRGVELPLPAAFGSADGASAMSADGRLLAVGNRTGTVLLYDVSDPAHPRRLAEAVGPRALVENLAFSRDGHLLAGGADDNTVYLWDVRDPARPVATATARTGSVVLGVAFSPDGRTLAAASADDHAYLYGVASGRLDREARLGGFANYAWAAGFSPDGRTLAVTSADHTTRLFDVTDPRHAAPLAAPLTGPDDYATAATFSPDGRTLAVTSNDHSVWLYDVGDRSRPVVTATLRAIDANVFVGAFSPDGRTLAAGGADQAVQLWQVDPAAAAAQVCRTAGTPVTGREWAQYVPGAPYRDPCASRLRPSARRSPA